MERSREQHADDIRREDCSQDVSGAGGQRDDSFLLVCERHLSI